MCVRAGVYIIVCAARIRCRRIVITCQCVNLSLLNTVSTITQRCQHFIIKYYQMPRYANLANQAYIMYCLDTQSLHHFITFIN